MSDSIEREEVDDLAVREFSAPVGDSKLRRRLLITNVALLSIASLLASQINRHFGFELDPTVRIATASFVGTIYVAPLLLAAVLAAWGPWRPWIRGTLYLVAIVASVVVNQIFALSLPRIQNSPGLILADSLSDLLEWLVVMVPAIFTLVLIGSWLRVRLGPPGLPPVRLSILSVMIATAILGIVMSGTIAANELRYGESFSGGTSDARLERTRLQVLMQAAVAGPIVGLLLAVMTASAYRWWARLLLLALIGVYGRWIIYLTSQSAPQFPSSFPNVLFVLYGGMLVGGLILLVWIPACIRLLDHSGWPCCRRTCGPAATP